MLRLPGEDAMTKLRQFFNDESGATAIEYVMIAAGISVLIVAGVTSIGTRLSSQYITKVSAALT
jgi:pilus assembly protein Flp/PilA